MHQIPVYVSVHEIDRSLVDHAHILLSWGQLCYAALLLHTRCHQFTRVRIWGHVHSAALFWLSSDLHLATVNGWSGQGQWPVMQRESYL